MVGVSPPGADFPVLRSPSSSPFPIVNYTIRRNPRELGSTGYMEIGPGRYAGKHWQDGFVFVWEDAFTMAEGILARHLPEYDHLDMNDVPREVGRAVAAEWRAAAEALATLTPAEAYRLLNLDAWYGNGLEEELASHRSEIRAMLLELADECDRFYETADWICVLGV